MRSRTSSRPGRTTSERDLPSYAPIAAGAASRRAVAYIEWSGPTEQKVVVPWTVIDGPAGAAAFAERLASIPVQRVFSTSISGAVDFGVKLLAESGVEPLRRVIDVSGDGPNNTGRIVTLARNEGVANCLEARRPWHER